MRQKLTIVLLLSLFSVSWAVAQQAISGTVTDGTKALIGVTIKEKGTSFDDNTGWFELYFASI